MLKKLNELTFFFSSKNFTIFNFLLFAFKIIMIKGIVYVQCQRWVVKLSLKEKYLVIFWCHKKKTCFSACNLFFNVWNVVIFPVSENQLLVTEYILILHALQEARDILVIPILKLLRCTGIYPWLSPVTVKTILHLRIEG